MSRKNRIIYSILTGLLLIPAWYRWGSGLLLFIAFIPLLMVELDLISSKVKTKAHFWLPALSFAIFNIATSWWIKNASFAGLIAAIIINTLMMTLPFWLFSLTHRKFGNKIGYSALIIYWLGMEYFYLNAEISWTWLNLGNGFANDIRLIQWYEYTGALGGTLWVLLVNILLFSLIRKLRSGATLFREWKKLTTLSIVILVPLVFSLFKFGNYQEEKNPYEIVVVQPNIDPYKKFNDISVEDQLKIYFNIADSLADSNTDYIIAPETFINNQIWLHDMESNNSVKAIREFSKKYPGAKQVIGITSYKLYDANKATTTAQALRGSDYFYDSFNTGIQIDTSNTIQVYHKSQLVVGVEKMPYPNLLGFMKKIMLNLGGTFRSHGSQNYRDSFSSPQDDNRIAPVICYESIFGEYVTDYISEAKANIIFVITNDGWWGKTPGYVQHNSFSALRAIENRRSVARSANTGISAFFNQKGEMLDSLDWWARGGIKTTLNANSKLTFYTKHGDLIGRISIGLSMILALYTILLYIFPRKK